MATQETADSIDLERIWRAFEGRDPEAFIDIYADDAELQVVDCNTPPSSPMILRGKEEIAAYWREVFSPRLLFLPLPTQVTLLEEVCYEVRQQRCKNSPFG